MSADPRRLVLLRHGRTSWNAQSRAQGHADVELDDIGRAQAGAVAPWVARMGPAALWCSDLARARQTAAYVEKETGLSAVPDPRLREYDVGERTGLTMPEFAERHPDEYAAWQSERGAVPGAESTTDVLARMVPALEEAVAALAPGGIGVVVTHGAASKATVLELLGWPATQNASVHGLDNCAAAVVDTHEQTGGFRLVAWNLRPEEVDFASSEADR